MNFFPSLCKFGFVEQDSAAHNEYPKLIAVELKTGFVDYKWMSALDSEMYGETDRICESHSQRVIELTERYETSVASVNERVTELEAMVNEHLPKMGFDCDRAMVVEEVR